jgi:L-fuculose-phosphate aldolase
VTYQSIVVETARRLRQTGLCVSSLGNVSVRDQSTIWITPTTTLPWDLVESQLVAVDRSGQQLTSGAPSRELPLHLEIYRRFPAVEAIVHTHSPWATAWSYMGLALTGGTEEMAYHALDTIPCATPASPGSSALANAACVALKVAPIVLLRQHGVLGVGTSAVEAFERCAIAEQQAHIQWLLRLADAEPQNVGWRTGPMPGITSPVHERGGRGSARKYASDELLTIDQGDK